MDLILCHTTADFDALGAAVGLTCLIPGSKIVLTGGSHQPVREFLALYRDEYPLIERRSVNPEIIRSLIVVDTQKRDRLGKAAAWLDLAEIQEIVVYDHHLDQTGDILNTRLHVEAVGATTTLIVEELQKQQISLTPAQATVMALGIHVDTGSLTYEQTTTRDALALAWLMQQGARLSVIALYCHPGLSPQLQQLLVEALEKLEYICVRGYTIAWLLLKTNEFVPGLSSLAAELIGLTESDAILLADEYLSGDSNWRLTIVGRSRIPQTNLHSLFKQLGGGGHPQAAALSLRTSNAQPIVLNLLDQLKNQIPAPLIAKNLMSSPVRTIRPETTIAEAQRILLRYGHSGLSVVNHQGQLVGIISRRDLDIALHHGFSHAPVKGYMATNLKTITPDTTLPQIEFLMVTYDIGRLPVLDQGQLVGIVTRTDILRELHREGKTDQKRTGAENQETRGGWRVSLSRLTPQLAELLANASLAAQTRGWHLYLVGGAVRDLLLAEPSATTLMLNDIDLVVDGFDQKADVGAGVELAKVLQSLYPHSRLEIHGAFQTAALLWHKDPVFDSLWVDIATSRTEFYPYPAANPEVEASSIRQDLYRRDFTINAMALRLTSPGSGEMLDFFGGLLDLQAKQIRVLHANSFIEDPTRIYRGVRFAARLGFAIEPQTEEYIRYAINSGVYDRVTQENGKAPALQSRLKTELKYILSAPYWQSALKLLDNLGALHCIHSTLELDSQLLQELRLLDRCLRRFDPQKTLIHWQISLEKIISHLESQHRAKVAKNLQLPDDSITRLEKLSQIETEVIGKLPNCQSPSEIVHLLRQYELPILILIALPSSRKIRRKIWQYLTVWRDVQPILNGNDLKKLGYKPGPLYRQILDDLLTATLDQVIKNRQEAEEYLVNNYSH